MTAFFNDYFIIKINECDTQPSLHAMNWLIATAN